MSDDEWEDDECGDDDDSDEDEDWVVLNFFF